MNKKIILSFTLFLVLFFNNLRGSVYAATTDCSNQNGSCQPRSAGCLGPINNNTAECLPQLDSTESSFICCLPGPVVIPPTIPPIVTSTTTGVSELCGNGINTAIGCIPVLANDNGVSFMGWVLKWSVGIGGGIAFLLILYGGFMVMTSQGNPERIKAGQELITSAVSGLVLLILSIFLLKFIGVDILGLDAFGFNK